MTIVLNNITEVYFDKQTSIASGIAAQITIKKMLLNDI